MIAEQYAFFPALNASLNGTSAVLLVTGRYMIARGRMAAHRACMVAAVIASALFLSCYLYFHFRAGNILFLGRGFWRTVYFAILNHDVPVPEARRRQDRFVRTLLTHLHSLTWNYHLDPRPAVARAEVVTAPK